MMFRDRSPTKVRSGLTEKAITELGLLRAMARSDSRARVVSWPHAPVRSRVGTMIAISSGTEVAAKGS